MGVEKSMKENDNDLAIVCFLQALRCRDIKCLQNEPFSIFFTLSNLAGLKSELSHAWAELVGLCNFYGCSTHSGPCYLRMYL
jgi:hypothetical protein